MQILRATELGMCFGVRDALAVATTLPRPERVTIHGELVHNPAVSRDLAARGFQASNESSRAVPATPAVLVTAHGISDRERQRLLAAGKQLIDTTCPLVRKAHAAALQLAADGRRVLVIGKRDHVEVRGLTEDLADPVVLGGPADVTTWPEPRLGVIQQTTTPEDLADTILAAIRAANPTADLLVADTICSPTRARLAALRDLLPQVDALVVVGGRHSNNTRQLVALGEAAGMPVMHVEGPGDVDPAFSGRHQRIGLTAGTSTLAATIDAVERRLLELGGGGLQPDPVAVDPAA